jgi:hypothetical protein
MSFFPRISKTVVQQQKNLFGRRHGTGRCVELIQAAIDGVCQCRLLLCGVSRMKGLVYYLSSQ